MSKPYLAITLVFVGLVAGCSKKDKAGGEPSGRAPRGLPPLESGQIGVHSQSPSPGANDPHAGLGPLNRGGASDPHAGMNRGGAGDPHAGMAMPPGDPHAGMAAPPSAPADPNAVISGTIAVDPKFTAAVAPGAVIFVSARSLKTKSVVGVARLVVDQIPIEFQLDTGSSMLGGANTLADKQKVLLTVVVDKDGDPTKKQGELEALLEVEVPAKGVKLTLDHIREAP